MAAPRRGAAADGADTTLVFLRDKSHRSPHAWGCFTSGGGYQHSDGRVSPLRSKASNRCPGCARAAAFEAMTMLRIDAETNSCPGYVLTLTSRDPVSDPKAYREACRFFWKGFRKHWGWCEYCGFVEWTTGLARTSGGLRRMHSHWLLKHDQALDVERVEAWVSSTWARLWNGSWRVQLAPLESVGGVVGYLALHHEKIEQAPPEGWTGRRLRPSQGYFAVSGREIRARARLWLAEHRESQAEWPRPFGDESPGRLVWSTPQAERESTAAAEVGRSFDSLPERVALERRLSDPDAPINVDHLSALAEDEDSIRRLWRWHRRRELGL